MMETTITLSIEIKVPYYEDKSGMTEDELAHAVCNSPAVFESRKELAQELRIAAIMLLAGEKIPTIKHTDLSPFTVTDTDTCFTVAYLADGRVEVTNNSEDE